MMHHRREFVCGTPGCDFSSPHIGAYTTHIPKEWHQGTMMITAIARRPNGHNTLPQQYAHVVFLGEKTMADVLGEKWFPSDNILD